MIVRACMLYAVKLKAITSVKNVLQLRSYIAYKFEFRHFTQHLQAT